LRFSAFKGLLNGASVPAWRKTLKALADKRSRHWAGLSCQAGSTAAAAAVGLLNLAGLAAPALWSSATCWTDFLHFFHLFSLFSSL